MQAKSFIDILAHELRKEIRAEVEAELAASRSANFFGAPTQKIESAHKAESVELWLNLKMGGAFVTGRASATHASAYKSPSARSEKTSSRNQQASTIRQLPSTASASVNEGIPHERTGLATSIEQTIALEFFRREGSSLAAKFSESELKTEFRKIALRIHPDRHSQASSEQLKSFSARFQTLVESAEILEATLA